MASHPGKMKHTQTLLNSKFKFASDSEHLLSLSRYHSLAFILCLSLLVLVCDMSVSCCHCAVNSIAVHCRPCSGTYSTRHGESGTFGNGVICFWRLCFFLLLLLLLSLLSPVCRLFTAIYMKKSKSVRYPVSQLFCIHNSCYM
jgi:hypothetical protein